MFIPQFSVWFVSSCRSLLADLWPHSRFHCNDGFFHVHFLWSLSCDITTCMCTYLYEFVAVSLCVCGRREKKHRLFFRAHVPSSSLPICQTHHLWQKICRLVSLHLAVTLATAAEVNCQLGQPTSVGCVPQSCSPQHCHKMYVAGLIRSILHRNVDDHFKNRPVVMCSKTWRHLGWVDIAKLLGLQLENILIIDEPASYFSFF